MSTVRAATFSCLVLLDHGRQAKPHRPNEKTRVH